MIDKQQMQRVFAVLLIVILIWHYLPLNPVHKTPTNDATESSQQPIQSQYPFKTWIEGGLDVASITSTLVEATENHGYCPMPPPTLKGFLNVTLKEPPSLDKISRMHPDLDFGGHYNPPRCKSKDKVAIIVPYRDREEHLRIFMYHIHPVLKRQMLEYKIFVIEQSDLEPFNRAMLFNVGFVEALRREYYDCFIFHDVDLIPENDHNIYNCPTQPRHMSAAIDRYNYKLPYEMIFGGVSAMRKDHFKSVNGFSNVYWGWGAEDDDMRNRIVLNGLNITRSAPDVARYRSLSHRHQTKNGNRIKLPNRGRNAFTLMDFSI